MPESVSVTTYKKDYLDAMFASLGGSVYQKKLASPGYTGWALDNRNHDLLGGVFKPVKDRVIVDVNVSAMVDGAARENFQFLFNNQVAPGTTLTPPSVLAFPAGTEIVPIGGIFENGGTIHRRFVLEGLIPDDEYSWNIDHWGSSWANNWVVGGNPGAPVLYEPSLQTRYVYMSNFDDGTLTEVKVPTSFVDRIDLYSSKTIAVGTWPTRPAISPNGAFVYVANHMTSNVSRVNRATFAKIDDIAIPAGGVTSRPNGVAFTSDGLIAWVTDTANDRLLPITVATGAVGAAVACGDGPKRIHRHTDGKMYILCENASSVQRFNPATATIEATLSLGVTQLPKDIAFTPNGANAWVACETAGIIREINVATFALTGRIIQQGSVNGVAIDPGGTTINWSKNAQPSFGYARLSDLTVFDQGGNANANGIGVAQDGALFIARGPTDELRTFYGGMLYLRPESVEYDPEFLEVVIQGAVPGTND